MKVKLLMPFFLFMLSAYSQAKVMCAPKAKNITIYKKAAHLGTRTEEPIVVASIYENKLVVNIGRFVGEANIGIIDETGCIVMNETFAVDDEGKGLFDLSGLPVGSYSIEIVLDNTIYYGVIDI